MIDLHLHTTASDGEFTPSKVVEIAVDRGMKAISITDHDTVDGLLEAKKRADELNLKLIYGIELSSDWQGKEVHILGYFLDLEDENFKKHLENIKKDRNKRNEKILEKLAKYRIDISMKELEEEAGGEIVSRTHIANLMMNKGYVYSRAEIFRRYLGSSGIAYVPKGNVTPMDAVRMLKDNGAIVSIAHPKFITESIEKLEGLIRDLKEVGLDAIETYYSTFSLKEVIAYKKIATKYDLLLTGGSDYHGSNKGRIEIGDGNVPYEVYEELFKLKNK